jgi:hypothetical protein
MSNPDDEGSYETLGLPPDATLAQVKARYREINNAYLKILESSRKASSGAATQRTDDGKALHVEEQLKANTGQASSSQQSGTEPIGVLKEKLAKGKINKTQFQKQAQERYDYLRSKPFSELSDSEFDERMTGFEKVKIELK